MPRRPDVPCSGCGKLGWRASGTLPAGRYTCHDCRRKQPVPYGHRSLGECAACGAEFVKPHTRRRCCDECVESRSWIGPPTPTSESHKARAVRFGVEHEVVDRRRVFARDKWRCGICSGTVDKTLNYPDPLSASLDHVVPMSCGGGHTYANTQCSHLKCNIEKSNRGHAQQLALI